MIRRRREEVTGWRRAAGSARLVWTEAFMGWPPQPVCWQICRGLMSASRIENGVVVIKEYIGTILYMGTEP